MSGGTDDETQRPPVDPDRIGDGAIEPRPKPKEAEEEEPAPASE